MCVLVAQSCPTFCDPTDYSPPRLLCPWNSPGKNNGVGCHALLQGNLPDPGIEPRSPTLQADSLLSEPPGKPLNNLNTRVTYLVNSVYYSGLQPFWHQGPILWKIIFPRTGWGMVLGWSSAWHLLCTLFLLLLHQLHSDHQALDPEGWEPVLY